MNIIIVVTNDLTTTTCFDLYRSFYVIHALHFLTFNILANKMRYVECNKTSHKTNTLHIKFQVLHVSAPRSHLTVRVVLTVLCCH